MHKYSHCCCCLSRWASRATSRSLSRAALMAAVADAVRPARAQRAGEIVHENVFVPGLIHIYTPAAFAAEFRYSLYMDHYYHDY